jgi:hypothetical protein
LRGPPLSARAELLPQVSDSGHLHLVAEQASAASSIH